jgi:Ca-activated chloride channel family protein
VKRILLMLTALFAIHANAQSVSEQISVSYVMVPFTAVGAGGRPLTDLKRDDVSLLVDGKPVETDLFERSMDAPVSFTILLDGSGSMALAGKIEAAKAIIDALTIHRREGDDFALYVFDSDGHARELVPFTENPSAITRAVDTVKPWGKTAFFDALAEIPEASELGRNGSRAIILLSDGIDNASKMTRHDVEKRLEGMSVPIYAFALREAAEARGVTEDGSDIDVLAELSSASGGRLIVDNDAASLATSINGIEKELRAQYLLGFSPTGKGAVKYRRISLQLAGRVHTVRVRAGYRGTEPPAPGSRIRKIERKKRS